MERPTYYITTPIYYPSDRLHIGHAYTTVFCDAIARWRRFCGEEVFFLTGSDDHGQKVQRAAEARGKKPKEYVDEIVETFKDLWRRLDISYDDFIRTTEQRHIEVVQEIFQRLYDQGDIYKDTYEGWYCTPCETFWPEGRLEDDQCPDCQRPVERVQEESYFFKISRYAPALLKHIEENPDFIRPETRKNEMVSFIKSGLEELSVSRTTFDWGIPVPFDPKHVTYVWIDALTNYITAAGYLKDEAAFSKWWPADVHVVGKDIMRFHTIIWPALLMAAGIELPKSVYGHGWLLVDTGKMSKSKGNVVDPNRLIDYFGSDALRYYLLREVTYGQDARYNTQSLVERINSDLANDLGNSLHRSVAMLHRFCGGIIPTPGTQTGLEQTLQQLAEDTRELVDQGVRTLHLNNALADLWRLVGAVNKYIDDTQPWNLAKNEDKDRLNTVMYHIFEALRIVGALVTPFLPRIGARMLEQLGFDASTVSVNDTRWGATKSGTIIKSQDPIIPRLDVEAVLEELEKENEALQTQENASNTAKDEKTDNDQTPEEPMISIDDFAKVKLRLAKVVAAEPVSGADRLLKLQVDLGDERRQIVAGIAQHYEPQSLIGQRVVVVANLKPAKLRGELSEGMLLAAVDGNALSLVTVADDLPPGSQIR